MALEPERRLVDLPLMTENEQEQLIGQWSRSRGELLLDDLHLDQLHRVGTRRPDRSTPLRDEEFTMSHVERIRDAERGAEARAGRAAAA